MKKWLLGVVCLFFSLQVNAKDNCVGRFVNPLTDICWSCLFPITLGSVQLASGTQPDTDNPKQAVCLCSDRVIPVGLAVGFWEPINMIDVTKTPYCMINLGGIQLMNANKSKQGSVDTVQENHSFYYVHWYNYPLLTILNLITAGACHEEDPQEFIPYLSELDPAWRDDELSAIINPEAFLFGNPIAQLACIADSLKSLKWLAIDKLFWCAGNQGSMYPLNGWIQEHVSGPQASLLLTERLAFKFHRFGLLMDSEGVDGEKLCSTHYSFILPKSRYRYQMLYPVATTGEKGCHPFGSPTFTWEAFKQYPKDGEDFGDLIWRKRNCCMGLI